jgi:nitroreductase
MKNIISFLLVLFISSGAFVHAKDIVVKQPPEIQKLPEVPIAKNGSGILSILARRKTSRVFVSDKELSDKTLGEILWAAYGVSHENGKRTIPTARDRRDLVIYVVKKSGTYEYSPEDHSIKKITDENLYGFFNKQSFVNNAQVILVYASNTDDPSAAMHAGSSYQNVAIYCAAKNIGNVVRGMFDVSGFKKALKLNKKTNIIVSQAIGY